MELQKVIKQLLAVNNFISLPSLGSFVQTYEPAKLLADGKTFMPPQQTVTFDPTRVFNDEVIEVFVQDHGGVSRTEAAQKVSDFVAYVKNEIEAKRSVTFDNVGELTTDTNGRIIFKQSDELQRASSTFGLSPLEVVEKKTVTVSKPHIKQPVVVSKPSQPKSKSPLMIAIAAVLFVSLTITAAFYFIPDIRFWENVVSDQNARSIAQAECQDDKVIEVVDDTPEADQLIEPELEKQSTQSVDIETDKRKALFYQEPQPQDSKTYYIISGSFSQVENAQVHLQGLARRGLNPEIIESDGRFRVAMSKFSDRNRALRELERLRKERPNESVWLLGL